LGVFFFPGTPGVKIHDSTLLQPTVWPSGSTVFHFEVRHFDCSTEDSVLVTVGPEVAAFAGADTTVICNTDSVQLNSTGTIGQVFNWSPASSLSNANAANPMAGPTETTTYYLIVGEGACLDSAEVRIEVLPQPESAFLSSAIEGCAPHTMSFLQNSSNATAYTWYFGDGSPVSNEPSPVHLYDVPGDYAVSLLAVAPGGCSSSSETVTIHVTAPSIADFVSDPSFPVQLSLPNTFVQFVDRSQNAQSWNWNFGDGITSSDVNPTHTFSTPGTYFVTLAVTNESGCRQEVVRGPYIVLTPDLFIPNVFSPNDDGVNDIFLVNYSGDQAFTLNIFDRWGVLQYTSNNKTIGWNGRNPKNLEVSDGVYYYNLKVGDREFSGPITLVR
jgi:gliding motility-associated-like protein